MTFLEGILPVQEDKSFKINLPYEVSLDLNLTED